MNSDTYKVNGLDVESNQEMNSDTDTHLIRFSHSNLSFEELINLRQKVGSRFYNDTVYGTSSKKTKSPKEVKRANKNRPRELSSKIGQQKIKALYNNSINILNQATDNRPRDPRFDQVCGEFNKVTFRKNYSFVNEIRKQEKHELEKEFRKCTDPEKKQTIKLLIQRIENKLMGEKSIDNIQRKKANERQEIKVLEKQGEKPIFKNKSVKKLENLVQKYEELKKTNKLQKHVQKRIQNIKMKDKKSLKKKLEEQIL